MAAGAAGRTGINLLGSHGMKPQIDLTSTRAREARLAKRIGKLGFSVLSGAAATGLVGVLCFAYLKDWRLAYWTGALTLLPLMLATWWKRQLSVLPASGQDLSERLSADVLTSLKPGQTLNPQTVWAALSNHWQAVFFTSHLMLPSDLVKAQMTEDENTLNHALQIATQLADHYQTKSIEPGFVIAGLMWTAPGLKELLVQMKGHPEDVEAIANWLGRHLADEGKRSNFGGIARDWAYGFTPLLDRFGHNLSLDIAKYGAHFDFLTTSEGVKAIESAFDNHATAVALIGPDGIGKTNSVHALAQRLIEGNTVPSLAYHEIVALSATDITSRAHGPGELEQSMIQLHNEAAHAKHIILFLDDAQLFFSSAPGAFDGTQILLGMVQARAVPVIMAMSPSDYQRLKVVNQALASLLTPVVLQELPESGVMRVLEDTAVALENRHKVLIAYEALREAYRLSGRYEQEEAYPGKAIKLLEQAVSHSFNSVVNAESVQKAIEQTRGVKVSAAKPAEADTLLNLEDAIHKRMINQSQAVKVVASALRRARAGVANPRRPIGSFLFLGPTGVGKTELAKAIAFTYFGAESNMIRLDMSEYQRPEDVARLLSDGREETSSLILAVRQQPFSVVLLDEIEKAHPNILNLLLQLLDEGQLTDTAGRPVSFKDCVIIATSNAGAQTIRERVQAGEELASFQHEFTDQLIKSGQFKPELLNRFDEIVLFRPLNQDELAQVVGLMLVEINDTLATQNISVELTPEATAKVVAAGYDPQMGARPMRRTLQRTVEDSVAQKILRGEAQPGSHIVLDAADLG
jgi:ATP-dependent Clp protease ATP-binding subunit ClpA